jgi:hypothetical protein
MLPVVDAAGVDVISICFDGVHLTQFKLVSIGMAEIETALHGLSASMFSQSVL